jgi:hypothetical protein
MKTQQQNANPLGEGVRIRALNSQDRSPIENMVVFSGKFNQVEVATAMELVDEALKSGDASGYFFAVLETGSVGSAKVRGYAC